MFVIVDPRARVHQPWTFATYALACAVARNVLGLDPAVAVFAL